MTNTHSAVPILEAPGNGLPPAEAFISRHLLFPTLTTFLSAEKAIQLLISNGKESLNLAKPLAEEKLTQKILINRFRGIEDSSRHWSVLMTISHLLITGEGVASNTEQLARGEKVDRVVRIEDVKPPEEQTIAEVFHGYEAFLDGYKARMEVLLDTKYNLKDNQYRHHHPWFGKINSHQWLCLNGLHHQIHLTQIKKIIKKL